MALAALFFPGGIDFVPPGSYVALYSALEFGPMVLAGMVFGLVATARDRRSLAETILGHGLLAVVLIDMAHTLSYSGMPELVTPSSPVKASTFGWRRGLWRLGRFWPWGALWGSQRGYTRLVCIFRNFCRARSFPALGESSLVLEGFDCPTALKRLAGGVALFRRLLANFVESHSQDGQRMADALASGDAKAAGTVAHTLKGVAAISEPWRCPLRPGEFGAALLAAPQAGGGKDSCQEALGMLERVLADTMTEIVREASRVS